MYKYLLQETRIQSFDMVDCAVNNAVSYFLWTPVAFQEMSKDRGSQTQTNTDRISAVHYFASI